MNNNPETESEYWNKSYRKKKIGWDIGAISPPLKNYIDQLKNKDLKILIPGAGNAYEAEYLYKLGFKNTFVLDFATEAIASFLNRFPDFPKNQIFNKDFFDHEGTYDLILEQTFFTSFPKNFRPKYIKKINELLANNGKLVGLWFTHEFNNPPPYGGTEQEYKELFETYFHFKTFEISYYSIKPRAGREFFIIMPKK